MTFNSCFLRYYWLGSSTCAFCWVTISTTEGELLSTLHVCDGITFLDYSVHRCTNSGAPLDPVPGQLESSFAVKPNKSAVHGGERVHLLSLRGRLVFLYPHIVMWVMSNFTIFMSYSNIGDFVRIQCSAILFKCQYDVLISTEILLWAMWWSSSFADSFSGTCPDEIGCW